MRRRGRGAQNEGMRRNEKKKSVNVILIVLVIIFLALFILRRTEQVGVWHLAPTAEHGSSRDASEGQGDE